MSQIRRFLFDGAIYSQARFIAVGQTDELYIICIRKCSPQCQRVDFMVGVSVARLHVPFSDVIGAYARV
jgi:hypothetical protein